MSKQNCGGTNTKRILISLDEFDKWKDGKCPILGPLLLINNSGKWDSVWAAIIEFNDNHVVKHPDYLEVLIDKRLFPLEGFLFGMKFTPVDELLVDTHGVQYTTIYRIHRRKNPRTLLHDEGARDQAPLVAQDCPREGTSHHPNTI